MSDSINKKQISKLPQFDVLKPYTIEGLRKREHRDGVICLKEEVMFSRRFTSYFIEYPSDELKITGVLNVPNVGLSHPVIILNHGYVPPKHYKPGAKTAEIATHLANSGYLTISPDFRGWGESDSGDNFFRSGLVLDVLNLIDALPSLPTASSTRIGIWGHSMGAGTALKAMAIDERIKASVLCAPLSCHDDEIINRWGDVDIGKKGNKDNPVYEIYMKASQDLDFLSLTSPSQHLDYIAGALQIHTGTEDTIAPPKWADEIYKALKGLGKTVEIYKYQGQGHYLKGGNLDLMFKRCKTFFDYYV